MKLYLFGPMRGYKDANRAAFKEAREILRDMKHEVFCPSEFTARIKSEGLSTDLREMLKYDLAYILNEADGLIGLPGWASSKGSLAEVHLAWAIGLPVYEYETFVRRVIKEIKDVPNLRS